MENKCSHWGFPLPDDLTSALLFERSVRYYAEAQLEKAFKPSSYILAESSLRRDLSSRRTTTHTREMAGHAGVEGEFPTVLTSEDIGYNQTRETEPTFYGSGYPRLVGVTRFGSREVNTERSKPSGTTRYSRIPIYSSTNEPAIIYDRSTILLDYYGGEYRVPRCRAGWVRERGWKYRITTSHDPILTQSTKVINSVLLEYLSKSDSTKDVLKGDKLAAVIRVCGHSSPNVILSADLSAATDEFTQKHRLMEQLLC